MSDLKIIQLLSDGLGSIFGLDKDGNVWCLQGDEKKTWVLIITQDQSNFIIN